jgi:hypothetical protein
MFHLGAKEFPKTADDLRESLLAGLEKLFELPDRDGIVEVEGGKYPRVGRLAVDLSDAAADTNRKVAKPVATGKRQEGVTADEVEVNGKPILIDEAALELALTASDVKLDFGKDRAGKPLLVLADARNGKVDARISKDDLEQLLTAKIAEKAEENGIRVEGAELELKSRGERSVSVDLRVKARKLVSAVIRVSGDIDIDDELTARLSNLGCEGEGMLGNMAVGFIRPHLARFEGYELPLMAFSLGDVKLRDLKIRAGDALRVSAKFGS